MSVRNEKQTNKTNKYLRSVEPFLLVTYTVGHGFYGSESPARATAALIADLPNGRTIWPLQTGIEFRRQITGDAAEQFGWLLETFRVRMYAHDATEVGLWNRRMEIRASLRVKIGNSIEKKNAISEWKLTNVVPAMLLP